MSEEEINYICDLYNYHIIIPKVKSKENSNGVVYKLEGDNPMPIGYLDFIRDLVLGINCNIELMNGLYKKYNKEDMLKIAPIVFSKISKKWKNNRLKISKYRKKQRDMSYSDIGSFNLNKKIDI